MDDQQTGRLVISLRAVAVAAVAIALASLGALVVVASIKNVDTLSTVALALAIIAFVAQLIVFVVQSASAHSQLMQSQELYGSIRAMLVEVSERAEGTRATVTTINERLLEAALGKAISEVGDRPVRLDVGNVAREVAGALRLTDGEQAPSSRPVEGYLPRRPSPDDQQIIEMLRTFPAASDAVRQLSVLEPLDSSDLSRLQMFADDEINSRLPGSSFDPGFSGALDPHDPLVLGGLITEVPDSRLLAGRPIRALTPRGREAARLLSAQDEPPADVADAVRALRERMRNPEG